MSVPAATQRTFLAVFPPEDVLDSLRKARDALIPTVFEFRWTRTENLHFTLRFFGDLNADEIEVATGAMTRAGQGLSSFEIEIAGAEVFPNWKRPRVLWLGTGEGRSSLEALSVALERELMATELGAADRPFVPHLTLGRWRDSRKVRTADLQTATGDLGTVARFPVETVGLYASQLAPGGSKYTLLHEGRLSGE